MLKSRVMRYRIVAYTVGTALVLLVFVGIPLQVWAHNDVLEKIVGTLHGFLYIVYAILSLELAFRYRFSPLRTVLSVAAGLIPILTFVAERKNETFIRAREVATAADAVESKSGV